jgi:hypothetical protein
MGSGLAEDPMSILRPENCQSKAPEALIGADDAFKRAEARIDRSDASLLNTSAGVC